MDIISDYELKSSDLLQKSMVEYDPDPQKPSVLFVGWHSCIRVTKMAVVLAKKGYRLGLITNRPASGSNLFDKTLLYTDEEQLQRELEQVLDDYNIIHVHNEPNALAIRCKEVIKDKKPIVLDVHDSDLLRKGYCTDEEIIAFSHADAQIHVSEPIREYLTQIYNYKGLTATIESRCPEDFIGEDKGHNRSGIVFQGGIRIPEDVSDFSYRNIWPICYAFAQDGYKMSIYGPTSGPIKEKYEQVGAICKGPREYSSLLSELYKYEWGLSGFIQDPPKKHIQWCCTNKFWEYIACGTPVIVYNTDVQAAYVEKYKIGVVLKNLRNIRQQLEAYDWEALHQNVLNVRKSLCLENYIKPLEEVYRKLL